MRLREPYQTERNLNKRNSRNSCQKCLVLRTTSRAKVKANTHLKRTHSGLRRMKSLKEREKKKNSLMRNFI
jgi:hypothetical protein